MSLLDVDNTLRMHLRAVLRLKALPAFRDFLLSVLNLIKPCSVFCSVDAFVHEKRLTLSLGRSEEFQYLKVK